MLPRDIVIPVIYQFQGFFNSINVCNLAYLLYRRCLFKGYLSAKMQAKKYSARKNNINRLLTDRYSRQKC